MSRSLHFFRLGQGLKQHRHITIGVGVDFLVSIVEEPVLYCQGNNIYTLAVECIINMN